MRVVVVVVVVGGRRGRGSLELRLLRLRLVGPVCAAAAALPPCGWGMEPLARRLRFPPSSGNSRGRPPAPNTSRDVNGAASFDRRMSPDRPLRQKGDEGPATTSFGQERGKSAVKLRRSSRAAGEAKKRAELDIGPASSATALPPGAEAGLERAAA